MDSLQASLDAGYVEYTAGKLLLILCWVPGYPVRLDANSKVAGFRPIQKAISMNRH